LVAVAADQLLVLAQKEMADRQFLAAVDMAAILLALVALEDRMAVVVAVALVLMVALVRLVLLFLNGKE
jgi:hypothetical protein